MKMNEDSCPVYKIYTDQEEMPVCRRNAGMSMIEIIIAVAIFAITAAVLLQAFVISGRINRKSGTYLEATTVAQNIMEEIKAKSFEEVSLAFNYPVDSVKNTTRLTFLNSQRSRIETGSLGISEVIRTTDKADSSRSSYDPVVRYREDLDESKVTASVISKDGGKTYEFNPRTSGENASKYYFELTNIENDKESFDALVTFDGSKTSGYKKKTSTNTETGKNDYEMPNISKIDSKTNALLIEEQDVNKDNLAQQMTQWFNSSFTGKAEAEIQTIRDDIYTHSVKTLTIRVEENSGTVKAVASRTLDPWKWINEKYSQYLNSEYSSDGKQKENIIDTGETTFYSSDAGENLKNIFVFYYPNYNSTSSVNPYDQIVFDNSINYELNLYVSKQADEDGTDTESKPTHDQESRYRMALTIKENPAERGKTNWNTNPGLYRAVTKLRTNLDYDISGTEAGGDQTSSRLKINQMTLTYQAVNTSGVSGLKVSGNSAKKILDCNSLDDRESEDRIYTVQVAVYKAGAASGNFPDSDLIASLEGSKED